MTVIKRWVCKCCDARAQLPLRLRALSGTEPAHSGQPQKSILLFDMESAAFMNESKTPFK
jgi:hypothetical protein